MESPNYENRRTCWRTWGSGMMKREYLFFGVLCLCIQIGNSAANFDQRNLISPTTAVLPGTFRGPVIGSLYHSGNFTDQQDQLQVRFFFSSEYENTTTNFGITRVFDLGGSVLAQSTNGCLGSAFVHPNSDLNYLVACTNSGMSNYHIQASDGINIVVPALSLGTAHNLSFTKVYLALLNSNVILTSTSGGRSQPAIFRIDASTLQIITYDVPLLANYSNTMRISSYVGSLVLAVGNYTQILVWDHAAPGQSRVVASLKTSDTIAYNPETSDVFTIVPNGANTDLKRISISGSSVVNLMTTAATSALSSLILFKGYPYLMSSEPGGNCIRVYSSNMLVQIFTSCSMPKLAYNNIVGSVEVADSFFYFAFGRSLSPFNFIPSTIHLGYCSQMTENAAANCLSCIRGYYLNPTNLCTSIPRGYGIDPATSSIRPCPQGCEECYDNFVVCKKCRNFEGYFQDPTSLSCIFKTKINDYYGGNLQTGFISACSVFGCMDCKTDATKCVRCQSGYYILTTDGSCSTNTLEGFGLALSSNESIPSLVKCLNSNCGDCKRLYSFCSRCKAGFYFLANDSSNCQKNNLQGYGVASALSIDVCADLNCEDCTDDNKGCQRCRDSFYLQQKQDLSWKCIPKSRVEVERSYFDNRKLLVVIIFKETIRFLDYHKFLQFTLSDKFGTPITAFKVESVELDPYLQRHFIVHLKLEQNCVECIFSVLPGSGFITGQSGNFYLDSISVGPITTSVMTIDNFFELEHLQSAGKVASSVLQAAAQLMILFGSSQVQLAKVMDEFELFLFLNGKRISLTDSFVTLFSFDVWNFIPNFLSVTESELGCIPDLNFSRQGRSCSIFNNHGSKLVGLMGLLVTIALIQMVSKVCSMISKRKNFATVQSCEPKRSSASDSPNVMNRQLSKHKLLRDKLPIVPRVKIGHFDGILPSKVQSECNISSSVSLSQRQDILGSELTKLGHQHHAGTVNVHEKRPSVVEQVEKEQLEPNDPAHQQTTDPKHIEREVLKPFGLLVGAFSWGMLVRAFDSAQIDLILFSFVNIGSVNTRVLSLLGFLVSSTIILGYFWLFAQMTTTAIKLFRQSEDLASHESDGSLNKFLSQEAGVIQYLYEEYRYDHKGKKLLFILCTPMLNMMRSGIELFFVAFLPGKGNVQLFTMIILDTAFLVAFWKIKPYRLKSRNWEDLIIRGILILVYTVYLIYQYVNYESIMKDRVFGWSLVCLFLLIIFLNYGPAMFGTVRSWFLKKQMASSPKEADTKRAASDGRKTVPKTTRIGRPSLQGNLQQPATRTGMQSPESPEASKNPAIHDSKLLQDRSLIAKDDMVAGKKEPTLRDRTADQGLLSSTRSNQNLAESSILMMRDEHGSPKKHHINTGVKMHNMQGRKNVVSVSHRKRSIVYKGPWINNLIIHQQPSNFTGTTNPVPDTMGGSQRSIFNESNIDDKPNSKFPSTGRFTNEASRPARQGSVSSASRTSHRQIGMVEFRPL